MGRFAHALCGALVALLLAGVSAPAQGSLAPTNTSVLPLILSPEDVPALLGVSPLQMTAFSCAADGSRAPVIFQVDDFDADGHVIPLDSRRRDRDESAGRIDATDRIVLMLRDVGRACDAGELAEIRGKLIPVSIEAKYFAQTRWVYFVVSDRRARLSRRYVRYSSDEDQVSTPGYRFRYLPGNPMIADFFAAHDMKSLVGENILDRQKFRFTARTLGKLVTFHIDEDDLETELRAVRVGPVRILREVHASMTPVPGLTISAELTYVYYERIWEIRVKVRLGEAAALFTSSLDAVAGMDYRDKLGVRLSTSAHPAGVLIDGKMVNSERSLSLGDEYWYFETGEGINVVAVLEMEDDFPVVPRVHFIDGPEPARPPESDPGGYPELGWELLGWEDLKAGTYHFAIRVAALPGFPERGARGFYQSLYEPITVRQGKPSDAS